MTAGERVVAIIQARVGSTRLPGKVLVDLAGRPLLQHVIARAQAACTVAETWVATTTLPEDASVAAVAEDAGARVFRGAVDDVLARYYEAARAAQADVVVRLTADDPFKDPAVIDRVVQVVLGRPELDYASNTLEPTYPEGLDVEAMRFPALARAWSEARRPSEREHVTPYIWNHPDRFTLASVTHTVDLSALRWTVDRKEDLRFARAVYERLYNGEIFGVDAVLALIKRDGEVRRLQPLGPRNQAYLDTVTRENGTTSP